MAGLFAFPTLGRALTAPQRMPDPESQDSEQDQPAPSAKPRRRTGAELRAQIDEAGGALRLADSLLNERDGLRAELEQARRTSNLPAGAVVLKGDDAKAWERYKALGSVDDLAAARTERDQLKQANDARAAEEQRVALFAETAPAFGWNPEQARKAAKALPFAGARLERREEDVDDGKGGKTKQAVAYVVTGEGAAAKAERLDAVVAREHELMVPGLTAAPATPAAPARPTGPAYPAAPLAPANGGVSTVQDRRAELQRGGAYSI